MFDTHGDANASGSMAGLLQQAMQQKQVIVVAATDEWSRMVTSGLVDTLKQLGSQQADQLSREFPPTNPAWYRSSWAIISWVDADTGGRRAAESFAESRTEYDDQKATNEAYVQVLLKMAPKSIGV